MKTLYLDCGMGAAGDMLTAALIELLPDPDAFLAELNALGIPGVQIMKEPAVKCGITGTHISVRINGEEETEEMHDHHDHDHTHEHGHIHDHEHTHDHDHAHAPNHDHTYNHEHTHDQAYTHDHDHTHEHDASHHHHSSMHEIEHIIEKLHLPKKIQEDVLAVYMQIAEAESHAHGVPVSEIHFHEVGTMDAIADVTAVCLLMDRLSPEEIVVSPVHVGSGKVRCAHGILPVPAPATAFILQDVLIYGGEVQGELCTPTGAALLKHFATRFGAMPVMKTQAIGYGMGKKDFPVANCVRAMLGESETASNMVLELSCNVDDMTAEEIGFTMDCLFEGGALEVYTIPIGMKKSRPGTLLRIMCEEQKKEDMLNLLFRHTTTIGVRETVTNRYVLNRKIETIETPYGEVRRKDSIGYGISRSKYEYDDLAKIAKENNLSLREARRMVEGLDG